MAAGVEALEHVFRPGEAPAAPALLSLHGTGGDELDMLPLASAVAPGAPVLSPRGAVREGAANRWFRRFAEGVFDLDDLRRRAADLAAWVAAARETYRDGPRRPEAGRARLFQRREHRGGYAAGGPPRRG